jgi:hypothetical protein
MKPVIFLFTMAFITMECSKEKVSKMKLSTSITNYRSVLRSKDVKVYSKAALELRKGLIANDLCLPVYHFTRPESRIKDPNGPVFYKGSYHHFYQFNPLSTAIDDFRTSDILWQLSVFAYNISEMMQQKENKFKKGPP